MKAKKPIVIVLAAVAAVIALFIAIVGGYVAYVALQYYRIEDNLALEIVGGREESVSRGESYSLMSYNLGFGAYSPEYSFFMDTGVMDDGSEVVGKYAKGMSKEDVQKNVDGQMTVAKEADADFYFFQEVDVKADRSYDIDMYARASGNSKVMHPYMRRTSTPQIFCILSAIR